MDKLKIIEIQTTYKQNSKYLNIIEKSWDNFLKKINEKKLKIYNGNLIRCEKIINNTIYFSKGITYKNVVGLRNSQINCSYIKKNENPQSLSLFNILISKDNKILLRKRNSGDWDISFEICGGFILENEIGNIENAISNKLFDDYQLKKEGIKKITPLNYYKYPKICEITLVFLIQLNLNLSEIIQKNKKEEIIFINNSKKEILKFINKNRNKLHIPSKKVLNYYLKNKFK